MAESGRAHRRPDGASVSGGYCRMANGKKRSTIQRDEEEASEGTEGRASHLGD